MENKTLFVGNLNFEITEEEVNELFSAHGTVRSIRIRPKKGTALVEMSTAAEAVKALEKLNQTDFKDRPLRISLEISKKKAKIVTRQRYEKMSKKKSSKKK